MTALRSLLAAVVAVSALAGVATSASAHGYGYGYSYSYKPVYYPTCHFEWRTDYYGNSFKVKVCN